jgi:hypothetical protein
MADRVFTVPSFTATAVNDTTALTNGVHLSIGCGAALQGIMVKEIYVKGLASSLPANPNEMLFARNSTIGVTPTALSAPNSDGPKNGFSTAPATLPKTFVAASTPPQRSATTTNARLGLSHNPFGGQAKWQAPTFDEGWLIFGITADISESSLSCLTLGGGLDDASITYEVM